MRDQTGRFLKLPYDGRRPTRARVRARGWNQHAPRLFVPKAFGWGYTLNFGAPARWLRRRRHSR
jgi:Family of unknown function (DUF5808)